MCTYIRREGRIKIECNSLCFSRTYISLIIQKCCSYEFFSSHCKVCFYSFFYDEVNSEHNVTFPSHLRTKTVGANQHIYIFSANVVQIQITKFASYLHTWQTRVNPFVRGGEGLTLETSAKKLTVACKLSIFRSCEGARKKM